jgi:hypothetical protein
LKGLYWNNQAFARQEMEWTDPYPFYWRWIGKMWDKLFASTDLLQKGLQASWLRNAVLRNNLANSETPDFKSSNVQF